jgi:hypothetical protein
MSLLFFCFVFWLDWPQVVLLLSEVTKLIDESLIVRISINLSRIVHDVIISRDDECLALVHYYRHRSRAESV